MRLKILILVTIIIFIQKYSRIDQEIEKYDYKPLKITFYNDQNHFRIQKILITIVNYHNCKNKIDLVMRIKRKIKEICQTDICLSMIKFLTLNILKFLIYIIN